MLESSPKNICSLNIAINMQRPVITCCMVDEGNVL